MKVKVLRNYSPLPELVKGLMVKSLSICLALTAGCRALPFPDPHLDGPYGRTLAKWTRKAALYSGLETRAFVRIVYLSPEVVAAQAREISQMRAELPDQAAATLERLRGENAHPTFFAIVYVPDRTANDWNEPNSSWRLAINTGFGERAPEKVERLERPFTAELRALYPYLDEYSVAYVLHFPDGHGPDGSEPTDVQLIAAGALGKMQFSWLLSDGSGTATTSEAGEPRRPTAPPKPSN
jgi:hypothetical protein